MSKEAFLKIDAAIDLIFRRVKVDSSEIVAILHQAQEVLSRDDLELRELYEKDLAERAEQARSNVPKELRRLTHKDATHVLHCYHSKVGAYTMPCIPVKELPDGRLRLLVFGFMFKLDNQKRIRYADRERVSRRRTG